MIDEATTGMLRVVSWSLCGATQELLGLLKINALAGWPRVAVEGADI